MDQTSQPTHTGTSNKLQDAAQQFSALLLNRPLFAWLLPLLGLAIVLSLTTYSDLSRNIWTDEAFSITYTFHGDFGAVLTEVRKNEETPPLYFISLWLWAQVFGHSEIAMRSLSLLCGSSMIVIFANLAQRWLRPGAALMSTLVMALSPLLERYMLEARGYTMAVLLATICLAAFERLLREPTRRAAQVGYALSAAALFLTSYFSVVLLGTQWLIWLLRLREPKQRRSLIIAWLLTQLLSAAIVLPWLPSLLYQMHVAPAVTSNGNSQPSDYFLFSLSMLANRPDDKLLFIGWLLCAATGISLGLMALIQASASERRLTLRVYALPATLMLTMALTLQVVAARYMVVMLPGAALAAGIGFSTLYQRRQSLALLLAGLLLGLMLVLRSAPPTGPAQPWSQLTAHITQVADPASDLVILHPPWDQRVFEYYYRGPALPMLGAHHYDDFYFTEGHDLIRTWTLPEALPLTTKYRRVWVFYNQIYHNVPKLALPYQQVGHWREGRLELFLYETGN